MSFNRIQVLGNLTRDPELRYTPQGTPVCTLNVASNDRARDPKTKEYTDTPTFFRGTVWGQKAEVIAQHFEKGSEIFVEGRFRPEEWTDREGLKRTTFGIQVSDFNFTGSSNRGGSRAGEPRASAPPASEQASASVADEGDDEIDFS
ncbi:MAG: single-stranded DNA-binding protein [Pyrinomonadaceae bacterium]